MILIAGPCVIEDIATLDNIAQKMCNVIEGRNIDFYFKASAIKDNRTKITNYSGVGMEQGISMLIDIKKKYSIKITTDFHNEIDISRYGSFVDLIQIPAYLAQQTSILRAASRMGKPIHIKKPQFLGPEESAQLVDKLYDLEFKERIFLTDRGTMFGYNQTMMDPRHIGIMMKKTAIPILVDVTHPNKNYPYDEYNSLVLARSAIVSGASGIFLETHPNCDKALCDSKTMIPLKDIEDFIDDVYSLYSYINEE